MDLEYYISSGILESYALGLASEQEVKEVECLSSIYPEIQEHLVELDQTLIALTDKYKLAPPVEVKDQVMKRLDIEFSRKITPDTTTRSDKKESKTFQLQLLWAAASIALLAACVYFFVKNQQLDDVIDQQASQIEQNENQLATVQQQYDQMNNKASIVTSPSTSEIQLASTANENQILANVYWNAENGQFLLTNQLPAAPTGKQYQFWAIVDGEPQDMGVIPLENQADYFNEINFASVDAFAITLEEEGGSPTPNLDQLKAIGNTT